MAKYATLEISGVDELRRWLAANHDSSPGIWLVTWRKGRGPYLSYDEVVDEAIAFGWVDSLPRTLDDDRTMRLLTPRRPGSAWSKVNKARVERLTAAGRMHDAGLAAVARARSDGTWTSLDHVEELTEPADLTGALDAVPDARRAWDGFPRSAKRAILEWIGNAKGAETRARRIEQTVTEAAAGRRANQWRQPKRAGR